MSTTPGYDLRICLPNPHSPFFTKWRVSIPPFKQISVAIGASHNYQYLVTLSAGFVLITIQFYYHLLARSELYITTFTSQNNDNSTADTLDSQWGPSIYNPGVYCPECIGYSIIHYVEFCTRPVSVILFRKSKMMTHFSHLKLWRCTISAWWWPNGSWCTGWSFNPGSIEHTGSCITFCFMIVMLFLE